MITFRHVTMTACAALTTAALCASPAQAGRHPAPEHGAAYVALGSSYAAGAGVGTPDPSDMGAGCGRTLMTYPNLVAAALKLKLTNVTCGGATTANIYSEPQQLTTPTPHTVPLQVDAVTADTRLVTITVGGNDVNYVGNLLAEACLADLAANPASPIGNGLKQYGACTPQPDATVRANVAALRSKLIATVRAVQRRAPGAQIILLDYPVVLPTNATPCAAAPIPEPRQRFLLQVARGMSRQIKHAAHDTRVEFIAASKISAHHSVCSPDPWMTGYDFTPGKTPMHPNTEGHAALADAIIARLKTKSTPQQH